MKKLKMILAAVFFSASVGGIYKLFIPGYKANVTTWNQQFEKVAVIADSGQEGEILKQTSKMIDQKMPNFIVGLGDFQYDTAIANEEDFIARIKRPFYRPGVIFLAVGGNHDQYALKERDYLLKLGRSGKYPWFKYDNYWHLHKFPNACLLLIDSAIWDVKIAMSKKEQKRVEEAIEEQVDFISQAVKDPDCINKVHFMGAHHMIYSPGKGHGDRKPDGWTKVFNKYIRGWAHFAWFGHEHVGAVERCEDEKGTVDLDGPWGAGGVYEQGILNHNTYTFDKDSQPILIGGKLSPVTGGVYTCHVIMGLTSKENKCIRGTPPRSSYGCIDDRPSFGWYEENQFDLILPEGKYRDIWDKLGL